MNKKIFLVLSLLICLLIPKVHAAGSISLSSSSTKVSVGSTVTVKMSVSDGAGTFKMSSSNNSILSGGGSIWLDNSNKSYTFTAKKVGTVKVSASAVDATAYSNESNFTGSASITINVVSTSSSKTSSKSSDNTLKSLGIEGQKIEFDKNKDTYDISLENGTTKIKISAEASDSKAKVEGTGEKEVKEGENKLEVKVTAENGDVKTYVINATVDTKPIKVTVDDVEYTLVKKKEELPALELEHEDMTLNFDGIDVPAYRIDKISYVLVGLKDAEGNVNLYKYVSFKDHETPDEYTLFKVLSSEKNYISYLEFPKKLIPSNYKIFKEKLMEEEYEVYKIDKNSNFCLFYGINILTGDKNIYKYDLKEKTIQLYDKSEIEKAEKKYDKKIEKREYIILGLLGTSAFLLLIIIILLATRKRKFNKLVKRYESDQKVKMAQDRLNEIRERTKE